VQLAVTPSIEIMAHLTVNEWQPELRYSFKFKTQPHGVSEVDARWLLHVPYDFTSRKSAFPSHRLYLCVS
jgi:hypothetical protein